MESSLKKTKRDKIVEDIINKIVIVSHDIHVYGNHYKYVLDDINLEDIKQYLEDVKQQLVLT